MGLSDTETLTKLQVDLTSTDLRSVFECLRSGQQQGMIDFLFENNVVRRKANNTMAVTSAHEFMNLTLKNPNWAPIGIARRWECGHKPLLAGASEFNNTNWGEAWVVTCDLACGERPGRHSNRNQLASTARSHVTKKTGQSS